MTGSVDPIRAAAPVSRSPKPPGWDAAATPVEPVEALPTATETAPTPPPAAKALAAFAAQMIAGPQRRGLRGGPGALGSAKAAYLGAEWSGDADRRTRTGKISKTEI